MPTIDSRLHRAASESYRKSRFYKEITDNESLSRKFREVADKIVILLESPDKNLSDAFSFLRQYEEVKIQEERI